MIIMRKQNFYALAQGPLKFSFGLVLCGFIHSTALAQEAYKSQEDLVTPAEPVAPEIEKKADPQASPPPKGMVPAALVQIPMGNFYSPYAFLVDKSKRTLSIWKTKGDGFEFVIAYPTDIGKNSGDKFILGDKKTPEGIYYFQERFEGSRLDFNEYGSRAFTMDYPNFFDQMDKKTGSGIWLHAVPDTKSLWRGSRGCVVVRNNIIQELSPYITLAKTPIIVQEEVSFISPAEAQKNKQQLNQLITEWKASWESKNTEQYINFYGEAFKSMGMGKKQWERYKANLNGKYKFIQVRVEKLKLIVHQDEAIARFLQVYESDQNSDFGEKTLYLRKEGDQFKIVGETWSPLSPEILASLNEAKTANTN